MNKARMWSWSIRETKESYTENPLRTALKNYILARK